MTTPEGAIVTEDGQRILRFERRYPYPPEQLWAALTDPDQLARWFFRATFSGGAGGTVRFDLGEHGTGEGTIIGWEEPRLLEYEWQDAPDQGPWHIRFLLEPDGDGTLLTFDHLRPAPDVPEYAAGWHWHLDRLGTLLAGTMPAAVDSDDHFEELLAAYGGGAGAR